MGRNRFKFYLRNLFLLSITFLLLISALFFTFIAPLRNVPILMYHSITTDLNQKNILLLEQRLFRKQMDFLSEHNYQVVSLATVGSLTAQGLAIPNNWVVLTFDDGYEDFYEQAWPILKKYKFPATIFIVAGSIGKRKNSLSWQQLEEISRQGLIEVGAHCVEHKLLPLLEPVQVKTQIVESKQILEKRLKKPVLTFAYPYGALNSQIENVVQKSGFITAVGTAYQRGEFTDRDPFILKRVVVSDVSRFPLMFRFMVSGYYVPTRELILKILNIKTPRDLYKAKLELINKDQKTSN